MVEDDRKVSQILKFRLEKSGHQVTCTETAEEAIKLLGVQGFDVVLLDIMLPGKDGLDLLREVKAALPLTEIIIISALSSMNTATEALRLGVLDYISKPVDFDRLQRALEAAKEKLRASRQQIAIQRLVEAKAVFPEIIYESQSMKEVMRIIQKAAPSDSPILILGESGTGKELIARTIHKMSLRNQNAFLPINCAGFPLALLESELFGYEKGAFTGAYQLRRGLFEIAHQGTIFMDEIADMSLELQSKLLRVLESGEFRRVGGKTNLVTDVRLIVATNQDLTAMTRTGRFRQDLLFRINTITVSLPPLRERKEDIRPLAKYFLEIISAQAGKRKGFSEEVLNAFERYTWPGNVRELRNMVERLFILAEQDVIGLDELPDQISCTAPLFERAEDTLSLEEVERQHILRVLAKTKGNRRETARILRISEPTLYRKLKDYNLINKVSPPTKLH
jgi:DNA-binding NtrC family response regulator